MTSPPQVQVLLPPDHARPFEDYCHARGLKELTLIFRLIRIHLEQENLKQQRELPKVPANGRETQ